MTRKFHVFVFVFTLIAYLSVHVSPAGFWLAGFVSLAIPFLLLTNLVLLVLYLFRRRRLAILPLLALVLGYQYVAASVAFRSPTESEDFSFSVLSYNVRVFNIYAHLRPPKEAERAMLDWIAQTDTDIKCLQEFYNDNTSSVFNATHTLLKRGEYQSHVSPTLTNRIGAEFGLAIFSRFPVLKRGEVSVDSLRYAIFVDLQTPSGAVRVYNVHLRSMSIDESTLSDQGKYPTIARKLKNGFVARARQVDHLLSHIRASPHPVVVGGDFNDIPYSYSYFTLRDHLKNAFEAAGRGFGFSYNGRLFFLRIDNQFFSETLEAQSFATYQNVGFSDHFPIQAVYSF